MRPADRRQARSSTSKCRCRAIVQLCARAIADTFSADCRGDAATLAGAVGSGEKNADLTLAEMTASRLIPNLQAPARPTTWLHEMRDAPRRCGPPLVGPTPLATARDLMAVFSGWGASNECRTSVDAGDSCRELASCLVLSAASAGNAVCPVENASAVLKRDQLPPIGQLTNALFASARAQVRLANPTFLQFWGSTASLRRFSLSLSVSRYPPPLPPNRVSAILHLLK